MSAFQIALQKALEHEGGYNDRPADRGGPTNLGISLQFLKLVKPGATIEDIKAMTREEAAAIYKANFWPSVYDILPQEIAMKLFDLAITMGPDDAHKCLQRALMALGKPVKDDGVLGPKTLEAMRGLQVSQILPPLRSEAASHYRVQAAKDPSQKEFLKGWLKNRAYEIKGE